MENDNALRHLLSESGACVEPEILVDFDTQELAGATNLEEAILERRLAQITQSFRQRHAKGRALTAASDVPPPPPSPPPLPQGVDDTVDGAFGTVADTDTADADATFAANSRGAGAAVGLEEVPLLRQHETFHRANCAKQRQDVGRLIHSPLSLSPLSIFLSIYLYIHIYIYLSLYLPIYLPIYLSAYPSTYLLSIFLLLIEGKKRQRTKRLQDDTKGQKDKETTKDREALLSFFPSFFFLTRMTCAR